MAYIPATPVCYLTFEDKELVEISRIGTSQQHIWSIVKQNIKSCQVLPKTTIHPIVAPTFRDANLQALMWLKENVPEVDLKKLKSSPKRSFKTGSDSLAIYRANFKRRTRLPAIQMTMQVLREGNRWKRNKVSFL